MKKQYFVYSFVFIFTILLLNGCATAPKKTAGPSHEEQVAQLQNEVQAKDQQIQELQYQLQNTQAPMVSGNSNYSKSSRSSKFIKASGVSVLDVQRALERAGFDPGPADGQMGKKTKSAIKAFQRKNNLKADGVVGERTWSALKG